MASIQPMPIANVQTEPFARGFPFARSLMLDERPFISHSRRIVRKSFPVCTVEKYLRRFPEFVKQMDPCNINTIPDTSDIITQLSLRIQTIEDMVSLCSTMFTRQERMFSLLISSFTELVLHYSLEGSELETLRRDLQETELLMTMVGNLVEFVKVMQGHAKAKLEFITSHDCRNESTDIKNILDLSRSSSSLICEVTNRFQSNIAGITEQIRILAESCSSTDSHE
ncbi:hypothetical protein TNIN_287031 [Trichonephila inaurata madagascariensis]|uniref:Uncharacterized protein n=1 Tax=Trichonephila inaurata madagascariensis TaxID=2747483 RepID=A0A8X7BW50_9ARAC|nr:hypothetical protein TNIN_287031 [Trichonephila inaurata madagascariensis]